MTWRFILINDKLIICMKKQILMVLASVPLLVNAQYRSEAWCPDNGNGTYTNPVINADYSDPDACVVGEDYYLTASYKNFRSYKRNASNLIFIIRIGRIFLVFLSFHYCLYSSTMTISSIRCDAPATLSMTKRA